MASRLPATLSKKAFSLTRATDDFFESCGRQPVVVAFSLTRATDDFFESCGRQPVVVCFQPNPGNRRLLRKLRHTINLTALREQNTYNRSLSKIFRGRGPKRLTR